MNERFLITPLPYVLLALVATIIIELGVLLLLRERRKRVLWASVLVNVLTNVPLNLFANNLHGLEDVLLAELLVVVVETIWYCFFVGDVKKAAVYGFLCNAVSFLVGLLVFLMVCFLMYD